MAFYHNDQKFSDQELGLAVKQKKQNRHDWCERKVREFFATKNRHKYYHCRYFVPEVEQDSYVCLPQEILDEIQAAMNKDIEEGFDPDVRGIIENMEEIFVGGNDYEPEGTLTDIDFDDYIYCYHFRVLRFDNEGDQIDDIFRIAKLTDEEYVQALTELLYSPKQLSFDGLRKVLPEVGAKILKDCTSPNETSAIFMTEFNDDVDTILKQVGGRENIPEAGLFNNPFIGLIEYMSAKND